MPPECANPLLLQWVGEWLETARERNSKGVTTYKKAYDSIKACPLVFEHPSEAQQLHGLGPKLCDRLTEKLKEHCEENGLPMPEMPQKTKKSTSKEGEEAGPTKARKPKKPYVPTLRSGPYALILGLATLDEDAPVGITKDELIELSQPHCDSSFSAPSDPTKFYTAWSSMKNLCDKDLVYEKGRPLRRYALTDEGWEVAKRIKKTLDPGQAVMESFVSNDNTRGKDDDNGGFLEITSSPVQPTISCLALPNAGLLGVSELAMGDLIEDERSLPTFSPITLQPDSFTVQLIIDVREIRAVKDRDYMEEELIKKGVKPIMRSLELGDALWIAKMKDPKLLSRLGADGDEVILDWIVERKRLDDLIGSIKDGRFHEQKFRLRKSGIKNVTYIIEEISINDEYYQKVQEMVESAIASTQVVNGYFVKKTQKMDDTIRYLTRMTKLLSGIYANKSLHVIPTKVLTTQNYLPLLAHLKEKTPETAFNITYPAFASLASKSESLTLRDVYLKMLMCTRGVTGEKALEIQKRWKTPLEFVKAFDECGSSEQGKKRKRELVKDRMSNLVGRKKIAGTLSSKIAEVWGDV